MKAVFTLEKSIGYVVNKTALKLKAELLSGFRSYGFKITTEQWGVLVSLAETDGRTQNEIAEKLIKDKTNVSRILDGMEKRKWIERHPHENDRRSYRIFITKEGRGLVEELIPIARRINKKALSALSDKEILALEKMMAKINKSLG